MNKKGFTLIELLVVVLIIGILAAVALPQYQVAVEKTKAARLMVMIRAIKDAQDVYYLSNNEYAKYLDVLDIDAPGSAMANENARETFYTLADGSMLYTSVYGATGGGTGLVQLDMWKDGSMWCGARTDSSVAERVCKSLGATNLETTVCGAIYAGQTESISCKGGYITF